MYICLGGLTYIRDRVVSSLDAKAMARVGAFGKFGKTKSQGNRNVVPRVSVGVDPP